MDEHVIQEHPECIKAAIPGNRTHPMNNLAEDQIFNEAFRILVFRLEAMPDHGVQADAANLVIIVVCYDTKRGEAMVHLDVRAP